MSWETVNLGDLCSVITKGTTPSNIGATFVESGIKYIRSEMLTSAKYIVGEFLYISQETHEKLKRSQLKAGDILFSMAGAYLGKTAILRDEDTPSNTNQAVALIRIDPTKCNNEYIYYYLNLPEVVKAANTVQSQSAQPNINLKQIGKLKIQLPDLNTQAKIVDVLSAHDSLIESNQKQIKLLEEAAQRLYKEWFVDLRFPGYENMKMTSEEIPDGWRMVQLSDIADVIMGQSPKSEYYNHENEGLPFHQGVGSYGNRFVKDETYSTSLTRIAEAGSILFSVRAPVGRLNITKNKIVIGRGLSAMTHKDNLQSFLFYLLKERFFKEDIVGNGSIFASISKNELLGQKFLIPPIELADKYNCIASSMDKQIELLDTKMELLSEARDRLLTKLMSGEVEL